MRLSNILNETAINLEFELNDHSNQRLEPHRYPPALLLHQHLPHCHTKTGECNHCKKNSNSREIFEQQPNKNSNSREILEHQPNKNSNSREIFEQQPNQPELHLKLKHLEFDLKVRFSFSSFNLSSVVVIVLLIDHPHDWNDWIGLDWIGLDWIGLDWIGMDWMRSRWRQC